MLVPALLSPQEETGQGEQAATDATAVRVAVIGQAAAGLTAAAAIIYGACVFDDCAEALLHPLVVGSRSFAAPERPEPHDGFLRDDSPGNDHRPAGRRLAELPCQRRSRHHHHVPDRAEIAALSRGAAVARPFRGVADCLRFLWRARQIVSLYFYISHARTYFTPKVVIPAFDAMATAAVLSAIAVGIALILLPRPPVTA